MACLNFRNTYFRKHLLMAAFICCRRTCFSKHLKVDALFIKQPSYFLLGIFLFKESPKKHIPSLSLHWGEGIPSLLFIMFSSLLFTPSPFKNFSLLAKQTLWFLYIYIKLIYIKSLGLYSNNETTVLQTKTIWRSLLNNLILQICLHKLNIWGCGYYMKTD